MGREKKVTKKQRKHRSINIKKIETYVTLARGLFKYVERNLVSLGNGPWL